MRTLEDVLKEYEEICKDNIMCSDPNYPKVYRFRNQDRRVKLEEEYNQLLPENQRMAILLHDNLCHCDHIDRCSWYYERDGIVHDWTRWSHKKYLKKADKLISEGISIGIMKTIFKCIL